MVITIDGPAGTGKSSVALAVAQRLGIDFLDTGAMYRAVGLAALRRQANLEDQRELAFIARHVKIDFDWAKHPPGVFLNGEPVGHLLRGGDATRAASYVAVVPAIREQLVAHQQRIGKERGSLVTEGRDQGSVVFPGADFKFYLDASPTERARRRVAQLRARGEIVDYHEILGQIQARDTRDATRSVGPLSIPPDAQVIDTTQLTQQQVVQAIVDRARRPRGRGPSADAGGGAGRLGQCQGRAMSERLVYRLGRIICRTIGSRYFDLKVYGVEHVPKTGGALLVANHQSNLDPVLIAVKIPRPLSFFAKAELFKIPGFSWLIRNLGAFSVRVGGGDVGAVKEAIRRLHEGHLLIVFPEGTRTDTGEMSPLQPGAGLMIRKAEVPVVPVVIDGTFQAMPTGSATFRSHPVRVMFGPPMRLENLKATQIVEQIESTLRRMLDELRAKNRGEDG